MKREPLSEKLRKAEIGGRLSFERGHRYDQNPYTAPHEAKQRAAWSSAYNSARALKLMNKHRALIA